MKKLTAIVLLSLIGFTANSQTVKEWVQQKKTQIEYLINQLVGLRAYAAVVSKGYQTAKNGLHMIDQIKEGDFTLHEDRFQSLKRVSPAVKSATAFPTIATEWQNIQLTVRRIEKLCALEGGLTPEERMYVRSILKNLQKVCMATLADLALIAQNGNLALSDDERLRRASGMQKEISDADYFVRVLEKRVQLLALSRLKELNDQKVLKKLYGIK